MSRLGLGPAVVLVEPQMAENIGMVARAMLNCGLDDLRLVRPRPRWPHARALATASGADTVIAATRVFPTTEAAIADLRLVFAATVRDRDLALRVVTPARAAEEMRSFMGGGRAGESPRASKDAPFLGRAGVIFGKESKGLANDDVALADAILTVPVNSAFGSLNLAQAVFAVAHAWFVLGADAAPSRLRLNARTRPATKEELVGFFEHLERELDACGFLRLKHKRPIMVRNLRALFQRAQLTEQEVRTLRGVVAGLAQSKEARAGRRALIESRGDSPARAGGKRRKKESP
ncbi:MAG: RNA methyltransferase [Alphaproteobacteria bacterium]|nr:RNA methyltransferase [Alphaproteobacteria bacterium]MBM3952263.1 RNA methyltransferase [Rhodospirillales bacterium]